MSDTIANGANEKSLKSWAFKQIFECVLVCKFQCFLGKNNVVGHKVVL